MTALLADALAYSARGWSILPVSAKKPTAPKIAPSRAPTRALTHNPSCPRISQIVMGNCNELRGSSE